MENVKESLQWICEFALVPQVCRGYIYNTAPIVVNATLNFNLKPDFFCEEVVRTCEPVHFRVLKPEDHIKRVLSTKPEDI